MELVARDGKYMAVNTPDEVIFFYKREISRLCTDIRRILNHQRELSESEQLELKHLILSAKALKRLWEDELINVQKKNLELVIKQFTDQFGGIE